MKANKIIATTIQKHEINDFFLFMGTAPGLWQELAKAGVKLHLARSEFAAAYMADGYARASYKPGICFGQMGPGATNLAAGLADAYWSYSPVIALTSMWSYDRLHRFNYQEVDQLAPFAPVTKWNVIIPNAYRAADLMRITIQMAVTGRPGPVHVCVPNHVFTEEAEVTDIPVDKTYSHYPAVRSRPDIEAVKEAAKFLLKAEKPAIVAGSGAINSQAWDEVLELAEILTIPVATTLSGKGIIADTNPLSVGVVGSYSKPTANYIVGNADVVLFAGSRADMMSTSNLKLPRPEAKIIHLDNDPSAVGRNYVADASMLGDVKLGLTDLISVIKTMRPKPNADRLKKLRKMHADWEELAADYMNSDAIPIKPHRLVKEIRDYLDKDDLIFADTGQAAIWVGALYKILTAGRSFFRAAGSLGWSFPAAMGGKVARPDKKVLCFTGDGGLGYHIMELETALRRDIQTVTVVLNNSALAFEWFGVNRAGGPYEACDYISVDHAKIARAYGAFGIRVERPGELWDAIDQAFKSGKPAIVDVISDKTDVAVASTPICKLYKGQP